MGDLSVAIERPASPRGKPPVLLIHGMFSGAWYWEGYQRLLAERGYESYALDLRGHHDSRPVPDIGKVRVRDFVEDALEIARTLANPVVIGHSMGGLIAQKVAESLPCRALVLICAAPPFGIPVVSWTLLTKMANYVWPLLSGGPILPSRADADALVFTRTPVAERDAFYRRLVPESGRAGLEISVGTVRVDETLVTAPTLVVDALDDLFVVPRIARAIARKYRAELREYPGFAHQIITEPGFEKPAGDVIDWLETAARG
jgi:pimeloyl-ACP methyl ester carboxylesterase